MQEKVLEKIYLLHGNVVHDIPLYLNILGGGEAAELAEVVDEMCLIVIAAVDCKVRPVDCALTFDGMHGLLKAKNADKVFWGHADIFLEEGCEVFVGKSGSLYNVTNCTSRRRSDDHTQSGRNSRMHLAAQTEPPSQIAFHNCKLARGSRCFHQLLSKFTDIWKDALSIDDEVLYLVQRDLEQRASFAGAEPDNEH